MKAVACLTVLCAGVLGFELFAQDPVEPADLADDGATVSGENCSFLRDPDSFLKHDFRTRAAIHERLQTIDKARLADAVGPVSAAANSSPIARRNFIDDEIFNKLDAQRVAPAALSTDEEFVRRIHLDLTGRIPSAADVRAFLADKNPSKREALIDKLLFTPEYADKWTMWFGDLVENNTNAVSLNRNINGRNAFYKFIWGQILEQDPIQETVYRILTATGNTYDEPNPAGWIAGGNAPGGPNNDTFDMLLYKSAKQFLGLGHYDCLLCHTGRGHLDTLSLWGKYATRTDAEQMAAFFSRTQFPAYTFPAGTSAADQQANFYFQSRVVSNNTNGMYAVPTTFGNRPNRPMVNNQRSVTPRYRNGEALSGELSWREQFAHHLVNDPMFSINFVNRVWKEMFNLGLVDAVDALDPWRLDPDKPPDTGWDFQATHPVLLQKLAKEFVARNYNLRELIKLIANSSAYQLSSRYSGQWNVNYVPLFARHYPRRLMGEEVHDAIVKATGTVPRYTVQGWGQPVTYAMQLPDTSEPRSNAQANNFMNLFLRGNRDTVTRNQSATIMQSAALMNDQFVMTKIHMTQSPTLQNVARLVSDKDRLEELYLTFLNRLPSEWERSRAMPFMARATTTAQKNAVLEDLAWALINKLEFEFSY